MPDFSPYKVGGMSLNPLRSLYDDINNILLFRTLQNTATRFLSIHLRIFNRKGLSIDLEGAKETQILDPSSVFLGVGKLRDALIDCPHIKWMSK